MTVRVLKARPTVTIYKTTYEILMIVMGQYTSKNVNNCLNTNIYSYLETSGGQSFNLYLNVIHFFQHQC